MHAKAFLFDDSRLLIDSCNLYQPSLDKNRELGIFTEDVLAVSDFKKRFKKDWEDNTLSLKDGGHPGISPADIKRG